MSFGKGTIGFARRTQYQDNGQYDIRAGHPCVLPIATDNLFDETYYLMITGSTGRINIYPDQYYDLTDIWEELKLKKPSIINLGAIYKGKIDDNKISGLPPQIYKDVIRKLKAYQDQNPSPNYEEIKNRI